MSQSALARGRIYWPAWLRVTALLLLVGVLIAGMIWLAIPAEGPTFHAAETPVPASLGEPLAPRQPPPVPRAAEPKKEEPAKVEETPPSPPRIPAPDKAKATATEAAPPPPVVLEKPMSVWVRSVDGPPRIPRPVMSGERGGETAEPAQNTPYAQTLAVTQVRDTRPMPMRFNPHFTINEGTTFLCTPPMPLGTQIPGSEYCNVDQDVKSMDLTRTLFWHGSRAYFRIERGLSMGQDRGVLNFTRVETTAPYQMVIPLDIVGASPQGQNGVPFDINEHLWPRLKAAVLLAGVEGLSSWGQALLQHGGGNQYFGGAGNLGPSLATMALQHDINMPVTGYRGPGKPVLVYFNHYVDLSAFFQDELRQ